MSGPSLTPEQQRAAHAPGSVAVVAGAGTGKTHMLAHRFLHHLTQGLSPLQIVAVTFTEKAAAELRARIRSLVRREATGGGVASDALAELEAAQISTLHALAARICRDHPDAAGVPPDFAVLEDLEREVWTAEHLEEALAGLPPAVVDAVPFDVLDRVLPELVADPLEAERALEHGPDRWRALLAEERHRAFGRARAGIDWAGCRAVLEGSRGDAGDKGEQARLDCLEAMDAFESEDAMRALACVKRFRTNAGSKRAWDEAELEAVRGALKMVKGAIQGANDEGAVDLVWGPADDALAAMLPALREAFGHVRSVLERAKRRARVLDFADLEVHALRALEHEEVRRHYAERWKAFLVDEFQDTNPVQARLLDLLLGVQEAGGSAAPAGSAGATPPGAMEGAPAGVPAGARADPAARDDAAARVTIVGDEKQAIYGFRGADMEAFRSYRGRIRAAGGDEVVLDRSFRSHEALVTDLNGVFRTVLGELHQDLRSERCAPDGAPVVRYRPLEKVPGVNRAPRMVAEAHAIAGIAREFVEGRTPVHDKATGAVRPARYGDLAVLARTWKPFDTYAEVLPALGVPAVHSGGGNLLDTREAKDAVAALRFLADPDDDIALVAVLRSPFFALDDRTLHDAARARLDAAPHPATWWSALNGPAPETGESGPVGEHLERARGILADLLERKRDVPPSRLLQLLDEATGYGAVLANLPGAGRRVADWRAFAALVRELERGSADVFSVARRLRRLLRAGVDVARPELRANDAVALMTIHHAKGLEWPIVIVADLAAGSGGRRPEVLIDRDAGVALKLEDGNGDRQAPGLYSVLDARRRAREEAEGRRVLYVALTRARDRVVLTADGPRGGSLDLLADGLQAAGIPADPIAFDPASTVIPDPPVPAEVPLAEAAPAEGTPHEVHGVEIARGEHAGPAPLWDDPPGESWAHGSGAPAGSPPALDGVASGGSQPEPPDEVAGTEALWDEALELVRTFDEAWLPYLEAARDGGAPPPDPDRLFLELQRDGRNTDALAVAVWETGGDGNGVALVPADTPEARYDVRVVRADPERSAVEDVRPLLAALGHTPGGR